MKRIIFGVSFFILILALLGISTNNVLKNEAKELKQKDKAHKNREEIICG